MNRNYLRPIASFLVLSFLLISGGGQFAIINSNDSSAHSYLSSKTEKSANSIAQLIFEEKEGEKGTENYSCFCSNHTFGLNPAYYQTSFENKDYQSSHPVIHSPLYLFNRSLLI